MDQPVLEHLYGYGEIGSGKTKSAISIASILKDHRFYYIQADRSVAKILNAYDNPSNVMVFNGYTHEDIQRAVDIISGLLKADSAPHTKWVIIDTIGKVYNDVQDTYSWRRYGMSADEHKAKMIESKTPKIDGWEAGEWSIIKRMFYNDIMYPMCKFYSNNYFLIAHQRPYEQIIKGQVVVANVAQDLRTLYQKVGFVPHVHHEVARWCDSHLHFSNMTDPFTFQTIKDTERKYMREPTPFNHFWLDYNRLTSLNGNGHVS